MPENQLKELKKKIKEVSEKATLAADAAKGSAAIAYQVSVENVKLLKGLETKIIRLIEIMESFIKSNHKK